MPPSLPTPSQTLCINPEPLTPKAFSPFGTAITSPLPATQSSIPKSSLVPQPLHPPYQPHPVLANQATALKYSPISPLVNNYPDAPSGGPGQSLVSMFSCFPRQLVRVGNFNVRILERHPFTTQTFVPLGVAANDPDTRFLLIVAPSLPDSLPAKMASGSSIQIRQPPDLRNLKAFVAHGGQAVTYGVGTWHAPMVVLGRQRVEFVVTQFVSGVAEEDCQEVQIEEGLVVRTGAGQMMPKL